MNRRNFKRLHHENGMSTLAVVVLLLFVATLVTLYTANSTMREQQVSANQFRADQALSAADAGLDYALAYYAKFGGPDANSDGVIDSITVPSAFLTSTDLVVTADVNFVDSDPATDRDGDGNFINDARDNPHILTSTGHSDDLTAIRTITIEVDLAGAIPSGSLPGFPLVAKGIAASGGNFSIINRFSNATVWTGADASALGSAETYVRDPLNPPTNRAELIDISGSPDPNLVLHASYSKAGLNSDVIEGDDNLANLADDDFFQNFMNETKTTVEGFAESIGQRFDAATTNWNDLEVSDGVRGLVWIEGDFSVSGSLNTIGTEANPITLIVNGDFTSTGSGAPGIDLIGIMYVIGDWDSGGNFEVQGGVVVEGDVDNKGTPTIVYDENLYDGSLGNPPGALAVVTNGTWKDW